MRRKTWIMLIVVGAVLISWDFYVAFNDEPGDTISEIVHDLGTRSWCVLISIGVLLGHFFWPLKLRD